MSHELTGYERDRERENERLRQERDAMEQEVAAWRLATGLPTPSMASALTAQVVEARDQARTATREKEHALEEAIQLRELVRRGEQDEAALRKERDEALRRCQAAGNDIVNLMAERDDAQVTSERMTKALRSIRDGWQGPLSASVEVEINEALGVYEASIRPDAPPPTDWERNYNAVSQMLREEKSTPERAEMAVEQSDAENLRLQADCAALWDVVERARDAQDDEALSNILSEALSLKHELGLTLLERLRKAEAVVEAARENWKVSTVRPSPFPRLLAEYDAVKPDTSGCCYQVAGGCPKHRKVKP